MPAYSPHKTSGRKSCDTVPLTDLKNKRKFETLGAIQTCVNRLFVYVSVGVLSSVENWKMRSKIQTTYLFTFLVIYWPSLVAGVPRLVLQPLPGPHHPLLRPLQHSQVLWARGTKFVQKNYILIYNENNLKLLSSTRRSQIK